MVILKINILLQFEVYSFILERFFFRCIIMYCGFKKDCLSFLSYWRATKIHPALVQWLSDFMVSVMPKYVSPTELLK